MTLHYPLVVPTDTTPQRRSRAIRDFLFVARRFAKIDAERIAKVLSSRYAKVRLENPRFRKLASVSNATVNVYLADIKVTFSDRPTKSN